MRLLSLTAVLYLALHTDASPVLAGLNGEKHSFKWQGIKSLIAFGDSYTFIQGLQGHPNYTFIGDNFDISFTPRELFSNRIVQNQTSTAEGGPNWVEFLTGCAVEPGLTDPRKCKIQLWDFAYAGANTISDPSFTPAHWNHTVSFERQIEQFTKYGYPALQQGTKWKPSEALVAVWIGINDINDLAKIRGKNATFQPLYEHVQAKVFENIEKVHSLGFRKFLMLNLPPLDRGPSPSVNTSMVASFNSILSSHADTFQRTHPDTTILQFDVNTVLNNVLDNYQQYGLRNITNFCPGYNQPDIETNPEKYGCGEGLDTYFWYNSGHLTSRVHEIFTKDLKKRLIRQAK